MPYRSMGRGTYIIDRCFPGVGRVRRASGADDESTFKAVNNMLSHLWTAGRADVLEQIRDGKLHPLTALGLQRGGDLSQLPTVEHGYNFEKTANAWIDQHECSEAHEADIRANIRRLVAFARPAVTLGELPQVLTKYRKAMENRPRGFNKALMNVRSFLRHSLGRDHVLYRKVASIPQLKERNRGATGLPLWKFMELLAKLPEQHRATALSMAATGMRPDEYFSMKWEVKQDRVSIYGTKRAASIRDVPLWHPVTKPTCSKDYFNRLMQQAGTVPYVCRKSFAHWMEEAGIPRARRNIYRAHESVRDMGDLYEKHEVTGYLLEDAERLQAYSRRARKSPKSSPNKRRLASLLVSEVIAA